MSEGSYGLSDRFRKMLDALKHSDGLGHPSDRRFALDAFEWLYDQGEQAPANAITQYLEEHRRWAGTAPVRAELFWEIVVDMKDKRTGKRRPVFDPSRL